MSKNITFENLNSFAKDYQGNPDFELRKLSVTNNGVNASCTDKELIRSLKNTFSIDVDCGNVCNQKRSGRCWMFSGLNVIRTILIKKFNVKNIELSQAYLQFYDKLEKANFFLEMAIEHADEDLKSRDNVFLLDSTLGDGGHFVMFSNLVRKYGVVPIEEMPDFAVSQDTAEMNSVLCNYLAQGMMELRKAHQDKKDEELSSIKEKYLNEVYRILSICLGSPVKEFTYEYTDKDNKHVALKKMTPKEFYDEYIQEDLEAYIPLCDAPLPFMKPYTKYTCNLVNNVVGGDPIYFFNVSVDEMKKCAINSLKGGDPIWFAADVSSQSLRKDGFLASGILRRKELFGLDYHLSKGERMSYRASFCNHAMTLTGVNLDENEKPNRWKVENSWGKENGKDGFYVMSDDWFNDYLYQVFINRKYIPEEILEKWDNAEIVKEDPFDTLWAEMR